MALSRSRPLVVAMACAVACSGCSVVLTRRPPRSVVAPDAPVECTSSPVAPLLDSLCAGYASVVVVANLLPHGETTVEASDSGRNVAYFLPAAVVCGASAVLGYRWIGRCRALRRVNARCVAGELEACHELVPGWIPPEPWRPLSPSPATSPD